MRTGGRIDRQTGISKLIVAFRSCFEKVPKNEKAGGMGTLRGKTRRTHRGSKKEMGKYI